MGRTVLFAGSLAVLLTLSTTALADWSSWLGPTRNGVSTETGLMKTWTKTEGPKWVWKQKVGNGFSAISAVGQRLYSMYADDDNEYAVALDARNGKTLWRRSLHEVFDDSMGGDGPRSTPTVADGAVYVLGARGTLAALGADDGRMIWQHDLVKDFGGEVPRWGYSGSPLLHGGKLFIDVGGPDDHGLMAFDAKTGAVAWHTEGNVEAGYSSPLAYTVGGIEQVVFFTGEQIISVGSGDGKAHWRLPWDTSWNVNAATPLWLGDDRIFISSGYGTGGALYELGVADGKVKPTQLWKNKVMKNKMATSVPVGGHLYGLSATSLTCQDIATGEEEWSQDDFGWGTLIAADGHLLVLDEECNLVLVEANPGKYVEKGRRKAFEDRCWTVPTLHGGILYLRDETDFLALDLRPPSAR